LILLVHQYSVNILFWDQWDFFIPLFNEENLWKVFRYLHSPHRQGFGFVIDKFILDWSNWDTRVESFFLVGVMIFAALLAILIKYKISRKITFADIIIPLIFLNASAFSTYAQVPNPSHGVFPVLIILIFCICFFIKNPYLKHSIIALINFLVYSNYSYGARIELSHFKYYFQGKKLWKECYLKKEDIALCTKETGFQIHPQSENLDFKQKLDYLKRKKLNLYKDRIDSRGK